MADDAKAPEVDDIVATAKERYQKAVDAYGANRTLAIADTMFVLGDSDNNWQWPTETYRQRGLVDKKPCLTVNVTRQHCNQIINNIRQNRPQCKVLPGDALASKDAAEIFAGLIRGIQASSHSDVAHDEAAKHAVYGGEGYWRILTDWESPTSFDQVIVIAPIENPLLVSIDPFCGLDKKKAQWGFIEEDISKEEAKRLYGKDGVDPSTWSNEASQGWVSDETVRVAEYYYCEQVEDTVFMLGDGSTMLESDARKKAKDSGVSPDEMVSQMQAIAKQMEAQGLGRKVRPTTRPQWKHCKLVGGHDKPLEQKEWLGSYLPIIQVVGDETNVNGEIVRKGIVRDLKDPARMVNYSYSGAIETVALQNKIPYIAAAEAIEGFEEQWGRANQSNDAFLPFNHVDDQGNPIPAPVRQQPAVMPQAQVQLLGLSIEQMRAASGQQNANFGVKSEAASGVGIQRLKVQGETATFHFPDNLARALHDEAVILIDLIPKVIDTRRVMTMLGMDGKEEKVMVDPDMGGVYADMDEGDIKKAFNPTMGKYGVVIDTGPSYQTQRQEGAQAMTELASRNPQLLQIAGDIIMKAYDFPFSDQLAERLKKTLPPELQDSAGQQLPPEVEAKMAQMEQMAHQLADALQACQKELEEAKVGEQAKFNEVLVKAYAAETDRITALGGAMTPDMVMALVQQTMREALTAPPLQPPDEMGQEQQTQEPPPGGFSLGQAPAITPPAMAATGANPGLGSPPILPEGMQ